MQFEFANYLVGFLAAKLVGDNTQCGSDDVMTVRLLADIRGLAANVRDQLIESGFLVCVHDCGVSLLRRVWFRILHT